MPDAFFEWSNWIYGLIGAIAVIVGWFSFKKRKPNTVNTVEHGSGNTLKGGAGDTVNKVSQGDNNKLSG